MPHWPDPEAMKNSESQETSGKSMRSNYCKKSRFCSIWSPSYQAELKGLLEDCHIQLPFGFNVKSPEITQNGPLKMVNFLAAWMGSLGLIISWTAPLQLPPVSVRIQNLEKSVAKNGHESKYFKLQEPQNHSITISTLNELYHPSPHLTHVSHSHAHRVIEGIQLFSGRRPRNFKTAKVVMTVWHNFLCWHCAAYNTCRWRGLQLPLANQICDLCHSFPSLFLGIPTLQA